MPTYHLIFKITLSDREAANPEENIEAFIKSMTALEAEDDHMKICRIIDEEGTVIWTK